jgi:hypothetical protein
MGRAYYLAGPMRGYRHYNFPAFDRAAEQLRSFGDTVINPADLDREKGLDPFALPPDHDWNSVPGDWQVKDFVRRDLAAIQECDAIYLLPGWEKSVGASAEYAVAEWLGLDIEIEEPVPDSGSPTPRKQIPVASGVLDYFPDAIRAVAHCSHVGSQQHHPGEPLHWSRGKSDDHADCMMRHFMERGTVDEDGVRHMTKSVWRALALLQLELEGADE